MTPIALKGTYAIWPSSPGNTGTAVGLPSTARLNYNSTMA